MLFLQTNDYYFSKEYVWPNPTIVYLYRNIWSKKNCSSLLEANTNFFQEILHFSLFSITVVESGEQLDVHVLGKMQKLLENETLAFSPQINKTDYFMIKLFTQLWLEFEEMFLSTDTQTDKLEKWIYPPLLTCDCIKRSKLFAPCSTKNVLCYWFVCAYEIVDATLCKRGAKRGS